MAQVFRSPAFLVLLRARRLQCRGEPACSPARSTAVETYPVTREVIDAAARRLHLHPLHHRHLLRGRAGLARPRPQDPRDHRRHRRAGLVLHRPQDAGDRPGADRDALDRRARRHRGADGQGLHPLRARPLPALVRPARTAIDLSCWRCWRCSCRPRAAQVPGLGRMVVYLIATIVAVQPRPRRQPLPLRRRARVPLSDMNGVGRFWEARAWFQAYWGAFALILLVLGYGLWRRGTETRLTPRLARLPLQLKGAARRSWPARPWPSSAWAPGSSSTPTSGTRTAPTSTTRSGWRPTRRRCSATRASRSRRSPPSSSTSTCIRTSRRRSRAAATIW